MTMGKPGERMSGDANESNGDEKAEAKMANFLRILNFGNRVDWFLMGMSMFTAIGAGTAMPLMFVVFGRIVNSLTGYFGSGSTISQHQFQHAINQSVLYLVYIFIGKWALGYISMLCIRISSIRISSALRLAYVRALFAQPIASIDKVSPGKVSSRITTSANTIQAGISQQFSLFVQSVTFTIGVYVVAFVKSALLTLVASACLPFILLAYGSIIPFFIKIHKKTEDLLEESSSLSFEIFSSIRIVVAFGAEGRLHTRYKKILDDAARNERKASPLMGMLMCPMFFSIYATFGLTFWFGIHLYSHGHIDSPGTITIVLFSVVMAVSQIGRIWAPIMAMAKAATASSILFATIDADVPDTTGLKAPEVQPCADIVFEDVSFAYPSRPDVQVLNRFNATFGAGNVTAIVGPSGSGKSTIVGLIERWYDIDTQPLDRNGKTDCGIVPETASALIPDESSCGTIKIGDTKLAHIDAKWWRSQIGLVQQEPFLFNDTIYNNVAFGLSGTQWQDVSEQEKLRMVKMACKEAYADEFISRLPKKYDTIVGESGIKLSGGQRQRLAIARSIVKRPPILILDEATSAIDVRTERIVQQALDRVAQNRTTIVIAHRLSTIKKADKIIVMRQGIAVEEGTHEQLLLDEDGVYHGLVNAQALSMGKEQLLEDDHLDVDDLDIAAVPSDKKTAEVDVVISQTQPKETEDETTYKNKSFLTSFGRLVYEQKSHWFLYSLIILSSIGGGVVYPIQAFIFSKLISALSLKGQALVSSGNHWALLFFIQAIGVAIAYFIEGMSSHLASIIVSTYYRTEYLQHFLSKRISFFDAEGNSAGTLTSRLSDDPHRVEALMGTEMAMALIAIFNLLGSIIISFIFGWKLALVGVFVVLPIILIAGYIRFKLEMKFEEMNAAVFAESSQFGTEAVGAFRTVTSLIMEDVICNRYAELLKSHVTSAAKTALPSTLVFATSDSIEFLCQAIVFWYGGTLMARHEYTITMFFVVYMAVIQGSQAAGIWFSFSPNIVEATAASNRIISMRPPKDDGSRTPKPFQVENDSVGIEFRDVHFTYKSRAIPVLSGLNLKIVPGQFAGLVGASGSGKSTIVSLLERFYDPDSGVILCGEQDITEISTKDYRNNIALVAQESTLYEGTIRENVALSVEEAEATDEAVQQACKDAQIHEFIISLPEAYATKLGPKAVQLSGGQRQRLALARALLRKPRVLLLDEATSSLDSESEKMVQEAIERAAGDGGRTVVAVAHRLATIQNADIIFVIGSGRVLEQGSHQELLKRQGVYYQMCQAQALDR